MELLLRRATDRILVDEGAARSKESAPSQTYHPGAHDPIFQSLLLYAMRPNPRAAAVIDREVRDSLGGSAALENNLLGLPVRGT